MSDSHLFWLQRLLELDIASSKACPTPRHRRKNAFSISAFENPFSISSELSDSENSENVDYAKRRRLAHLNLLPKSAPPPPHRVEEPGNKSASEPKSQPKSTKFRKMQIAYPQFPRRFATISESSEESELKASTVSKLLPKSAPPPSHTVEAPGNNSASESRSQTKSKNFPSMQTADPKIPRKYATISESSETSELKASTVSKLIPKSATLSPHRVEGPGNRSEFESRSQPKSKKSPMRIASPQIPLSKKAVEEDDSSDIDTIGKFLTSLGVDSISFGGDYERPVTAVKKTSTSRYVDLNLDS